MKMLMISPAKLNLFLYITGYHKGLHELQTLFCKLPTLYDEIFIEESDKLEIISTPYIENNIVGKVVKELGVNNIRITIKKNIPIGAGLGGGSSNAATVLMALSNDHSKNINIARKLGYDIEFFLYNENSVFFDVDDREKVELGISLPLLVVAPDFQISTQAAFDEVRYDMRINRFQRSLDFSDIIKHVYNGDNQLYQYAYRIDERVETVMSELGLYEGMIFTRMSGSGSTCFGLFNSIAAAEEAGRKIKASYPTWLCHSHLLKI